MQTSARISKEDLHQLGFTVVGNEAVPLGEYLPDSTWELDRLAVYARGELVNSVQAEQAAILQAHKSAVHLFRAGCALAVARDKCKAEGHGAWAKWKRKHDLADTSVNDAIRLYETAQTEDALADMGITQAKEKYVYPTRTQAGQGPPTEGSPQKKRRTKPSKSQTVAGPKSASRRTRSEPSPDRNAQGNTNLATQEEHQAVNGQVSQQTQHGVQTATKQTSDGQDGQQTHQDEGHESESEQAEGPDQEDLGTLRIGPGAVAKAESEEFASISAVDRERKLLVCGRWDRRAKEAVARGIAVLVVPELREARS